MGYDDAENISEERRSEDIAFLQEVASRHMRLKGSAHELGHDPQRTAEISEMTRDFLNEFTGLYDSVTRVRPQLDSVDEGVVKAHLRDMLRVYGEALANRTDGPHLDEERKKIKAARETLGTLKIARKG